MTLEARFDVYGADIDELKEAAFAEAVRFFRTHDDNIEIVELEARPVVRSGEGHITRWRADVKVKMEEDDE